MLSIQRILWPTDFSKGAEAAFPYAAVLADWHGAELHVLNVREGGDAVQADMDAQFPVSERRLADRLPEDEAPSKLPDVDALSLIQEQVDAPSPAEAIVSYVDAHDIDLVVSGTHGRRGLRRLLMGSVAEEVLRRVSCPVLTVRDHEARAAWDVQNILAPVDFSGEGDAAVRHARELAFTYGAKITLLHAVEEVIYPSTYGLEMADAPGPEVVKRVEQSLASLARDEIGYEHVLVEAIVGYAPSVILDYQEEQDVDLIVISTHGRSGLERLLLGSVTERVARRASVPVFVVKSFGKSLLPSTAE